MTTLPPSNEDRSRDSGLARAIAVLLRHARLILLCLVVTTAAAVGLSLLQQKEYSAVSVLLFRDTGFAQDLFGSSATPITDPTREAATNQKLVGLQVVATRTSEALGESLSADEVLEAVTITSEGQSDVISVTATDPSPARAARIANTVARQFIVFRANADRSKLLQAKRLAELEFRRLSPSQQQGVRGASLSRAAEEVGVLASLQTGNAELVQPATVPESPSSPKPMRAGILGAILGLLLGISLAFLFERLNQRLREPEEVREALGLPILATVPESTAIARSNTGSLGGELPYAESEIFRTLRASLRYFNVDREIRSVLITSAEAGVGKSTVSWNLALSAATSSKTVILETDLRNPSLARQHGLTIAPGLAELLTHQVELDEAIQSRPIVVGGNETSGGDHALDVIVAGAPPPNPVELIESQAMGEVVSRLGERYDFVIIDTAPTGVVSDAFPLLRKVDGVIVAARMGVSRSDSAKRLREQLDQLRAPCFGGGRQRGEDETRRAVRIWLWHNGQHSG